MKLIFTKAAMKDARKIKDKNQQQKIEAAILEMKAAQSLSDITNVKRLKGHPFAYRKRIGDYRLGFLLRDNELVVSRILKRSDIYNVFP